MAERRYALVKPDLLRWARETAGLTQEAAARKVGIKPDRISEWETGALNPTVPQLRKAADVYKRPLAAFFLQAPPVEPAPPHDFRRPHGDEISAASPALRLELRRARRRRAVARQLADELGIAVPLFRLRTTLDEDPELVAIRGREWLGVQLGEQERWHGRYEALNGWISALEARAVMVFQTGDVGLDEMRGFSLPEREFPVIVLNGKDSPRGRTFTLMHEFSHLMLDRGGVCDPSQMHMPPHTPNARVEVFCNWVAGAVLVPPRELLSDPRISDVQGKREWPDSVVSALADRFAVSREVILRRLLTLGRTTEAFYRRKRAEFLAAYQHQTARQREERGFAPPSRLAVRNNGRRYTRLVLEALERDRITPADVSDYLGVRLKHLDDITMTVQRTTAEA